MILFILALFHQVDTTYDLCDFRIPDAGLMKWEVDGNLKLSGWSSDYTDYYFDDEYIVEETAKNQDGRAGTKFWLARMNERSDFSLYSSLGFSGDKEEYAENVYHELDFIPLYPLNSTETWDTFSGYYDPVKLKNETEWNMSGGLRMDVDWDYYPFKKIFFTGIGISFNSDAGINSTTGFLYDEILQRLSYDTLGSRGYDFHLSLKPRLGVGRLRPLEFPSRALALEEILREELGLKADPELVREIAELYARRWVYPVKYWHSDWEFYQNMEQILEKYGIEPGRMRIRSWMRVIESSSLWDFYRDDFQGYGRPYGIRFYLQAWASNSYYNDGYLSIQHDDDSITIKQESNTWSYRFDVSDPEAVLEGGYPLNRFMHLTGRVYYTSPIFYSLDRVNHIEMTSYNGWQDTFIVDTTYTDSLLKLESFEIRYRLALRTYLIYTLNVETGLWGDFRKRVYPDTSEIYRFSTNRLFVEAQYNHRNRLSFEVGGSAGITWRRNNVEDPRWYFSASARAGLSYRIF